jgi:hypothetical protein
MDPRGLLGTSWAQFGDQVLLYADDTEGEDLAAHAGRGALRLKAYSAPVKTEHMHIVVQNGRLFQQAHPDVPVIVDRGRMLLVDLAPARVRQVADQRLTCYGVLPLAPHHLVFAVRDATAARSRRVEWIEQLVHQVSRPSFEATLIHLASFPTRHSTSIHYAHAASWARDQLQALQYATQVQRLTVNGRSSQNVIADKQGHRSPAHERGLSRRPTRPRLASPRVKLTGHGGRRRRKWRVAYVQSKGLPLDGLMESGEALPRITRRYHPAGNDPGRSP